MDKSQVIMLLVSGVNIMIISVAGMAIFMRGLFMPFLKVKMSGGSKLLVKVLHPVQSYYVTGKLDEGFLVFRDRGKNDRRIPYVEGCIDRAAGVYWTGVDDEKNCMIRRFDGKGVEGHDAVKYDELYKRALYKPNSGDSMLLKVMLILMIVLVIIGFIVAVLSFKSMQNSGAAVEMLGSLVNTTNAGMVV